MSWNESALFSLFVNAALKSTAVLAIAWLAAFLLRKRSAAARHMVWTGAAAALVALPVLAVVLPALHVPVLLAPVNTGILFQTTVTASGAAGAVSNASHAAGAVPVAPAPWRPDWVLYAMLAWAAGAALGLLQMIVAAVAVARVRRAAVPFGDANLCRGLAHSLGIRHAVDVLEAAPGTMPMTFGVLHNAILLPADAAQWSEDRRRVVLLHELAHVRRGDTASHLLARIALSLNWWNPLAWTAWRQFLKEREIATDDLVLQAGARASDYAGHLLEVARTMQATPAMGWAAIAMARPSQLEGRLLAILDPRVNRSCPRRASAGLAALLAVAAMVPLAAVQAQESVTQSVAPDVDATIRAANTQKNHEMLENAASAFENLRQFDTAQKLLESAAAIRAEVSGQQSADYGLGLLKLGELEQRRNLDKSAEDFFQRAAQILGDRPEASKALMYLGTSAFIRKEYQTAVTHFLHVQRIDPATAGTATMWIALVREREKNYSEAEALFQNALALENPRSTDAATTMVLYAQLLRQQGRIDEAADLEKKSTEIRQRPQQAGAVSGSGGVVYRTGGGVTTPVPVPTPVLGPGVYRVGGGVTAPSLVSKVEPQYSELARAAKYQGSVVLSVEVGPDGIAHNIQVMRSLGLGLDEKAVEAVSQWRFNPGTKNGSPVTVAASIEVNFRLL
jgi:TonB family protein